MAVRFLNELLLYTCALFAVIGLVLAAAAPARYLTRKIATIGRSSGQQDGCLGA